MQGRAASGSTRAPAVIRVVGHPLSQHAACGAPPALGFWARMSVAKSIVLDARIEGVAPSTHVIVRSTCGAVSLASSSAGPEDHIEGPAGVKVRVPRSPPPQRSHNWETGFSTSSVQLPEASTAFIGPAIHSPPTPSTGPGRKNSRMLQIVPSQNTRF